MHYYKIKIMKTSGYLNESAGKAPKVLYVESKEALSERQALIRASKKYKGMYGAEIRVADVEQISEGVWDSLKGAWDGTKNLYNTAKNVYVNGRNASRINSIIKNVINIINTKIAPEIQKSANFGGFTQEQLQQIQSAVDNVMNTATPAQEEDQPQQPQQQQQQQQQQPKQPQQQSKQPQPAQPAQPQSANQQSANKTFVPAKANPNGSWQGL